MGHDELTTEELLRPVQRRIYTVYGVRVADDTNWTSLPEDDPAANVCMNNGEVGLLHAGALGKHRPYLIVRWDTIEPGEEVYHSGEYPNANKFDRDRWNDDLRAEADRLGWEIVRGPGWFTIPSED